MEQAGRLQQALIEGQHAARLRLAAGLNPYPVGSDEYAEWYRGWFVTLSRQHLLAA